MCLCVTRHHVVVTIIHYSVGLHSYVHLIFLPIIVREKYFYTFHKYYHGQVLAAVVRTFDIQLPIIVREKFLHQSHAALTDVVHAQAAVVGV